MDKLWKWVMHLNAKAFCLLAALVFFAIGAWCGFLILNPPAPLQDGGGGSLPDLHAPATIGTLAFVSNQLAAETLAIPVDPFRPTLEAIFTNASERAAFLKALRAAQAAAAGVTPAQAAGKKEDPFAHLRKRDPNAGGLTGPDGQAMVIPKLTFLGFIKRPDGTSAAVFHDSVEDTTVFYDSGKPVRGVDLVSANVREAEIRFPDGTTRKLPIGESVELAAEPDRRPPKKPVPPAAPPKAAGAAPQKAAGWAAKPAKPPLDPAARAAAKAAALKNGQRPARP